MPDALGPGHIPGQNPATPERMPGHTRANRNSSGWYCLLPFPTELAWWGTEMDQPVQIFEYPDRGLMASALAAAIATLRLSWVEPADAVRWQMARLIISARRSGDTTMLALAEGGAAGRTKFVRLPGRHNSTVVHAPSLRRRSSSARS